MRCRQWKKGNDGIECWRNDGYDSCIYIEFGIVCCGNVEVEIVVWIGCIFNENMVEWNAEMLIQTFEEMREEIEMCIKEENVLTYLDM